MNPDNPKLPPDDAKTSSNSENGTLDDSELEEVVGGMQNQLNNNPTGDQAGGANSKIASNPAKASIQCNAIYVEKLS